MHEGSPSTTSSFDVVVCQHALHRFNEPASMLADMRRVLAPGGRLAIMAWGPIEENPAFAVELDAIIKSGLDESGVIEALLDAFAWHRIDDLRGTRAWRRVHRHLVSDRADARPLPGARNGSGSTLRFPRCPGPGVIAANRPACSSCPGPPSC